MNKIIISFLSLFFISYSIACDKSTASLVSETDNGNGTYTYSINVCLQMLGVEGIPGEFDFLFAGGTVTNIVSSTPGIVKTTGNDPYNYSKSGLLVKYTSSSIFATHSTMLFCNTITITTTGRPATITVKPNLSYPGCDKVLTIPSCTTPAAPTVSNLSYCQNSVASALTATASFGGTLNWYGTNAVGGVASATAPTPSTSSVGTTSYYVSQTVGCEGPRAKIDVTITAPTTPTFTQVAAICSGGTFTLPGTSNNNITGAWSPANNTASTTLYTFTPTVGQCANSTTMTVTVNTTPVLAITNPPAVCSPSTVNITAPSVTAGSSGGGILSYWTNAAGTISLANPSAIGSSGTFYIKSTLGTCSDIDPVAVTINTTPSLNITNPVAVCSPATVNITAPAVTAGSTGAGTLTYWTNASATNALASPNSIGSSGTYYIKSANGACFDVEPVSIVINASPVLVITSPAAVCSPSTVDITVASVTAGSTNSGVMTYWTNALGTIALNNPTSINSSGTFYIKTTSNGCSDIKPVTVTVNTTPVLTITNPTAVCSPNNVDITAGSVTTGSTGSGILTYWTDVLATNTLSSPSSVSGGTYYIKSTVGTCFDIKAVTTTVNTSPSLTITNPATVCSPSTVNITSGSVTFGSTGGGVLSYWTNVGATNTLANPSAVSSTGTYYIKSTLGSCTDIKPVSVVVNNCSCPLTLSITNPLAVCSPNTINITAPAITVGSTGGGVFTYWTNALATVSLANPSSINTSGTYYIKSDNGSCSDVKPVVVSINTTPSLVINTPSVVCLPSTIDITLGSITSGSSGGGVLSYWSDNLATVALATPSVLSTSGTFYIKATNGSCSDIKPINITINPSPQLIITNPSPVCSPSTVDITAPEVTTGSPVVGTNSYWTDAACSIPLTNPTSIGTTGIYYIKSTNGTCFDSKSISVTVNNTPVLQITNPSVVCMPATIDITNASVTSGSTFSSNLSYWTDAAATNPLASPGVIASSGIFYIKASNSNCEDVKAVSVTINNCSCPLALAITNPGSVCSPSTVDLTQGSITTGSTGGGALTYWQDALATIPLLNPNAINATGTYYIKSDNGSCNDTKPVSVVINTTPSLVITNPSNVCSPATVDLTSNTITSGSTGTGVLSYWNDLAASIGLANPAAIQNSGKYYIKSMVGNCFDIKSVDVTIQTAPTLVINDPVSVCFPGTIDITASQITNGSTYGLTYTYWQDVNATLSLLNSTTISTTGIYFIKGSDGLCSTVSPVNVSIKPLPTIIVSDPSPVCTPQTVDITDPNIVLGSTAGGSYSYWADQNATQILLNPTTVSAAGKYYIQLTVNGCSIVNDVDVTINTSPILIISDPSPVCFPTTVDLTLAQVTSGSSVGVNLTYWQDALATQSLNSPSTIASNGTYYIQASLGNCSAIQAVQVLINQLPDLQIHDPLPVCSPLTIDLTNNAVVQGSTGAGNYSFFSDAQGLNVLNNPAVISQSGTYYIKKDNGICFDIQPVNVVVNTTPSLQITNPTSVCFPSTVDLSAGSITAGSTGNGTLTYWNDAFATISTPNYMAIASSGTFYIRSTLGNCFDIKPVTTTINTPPMVTPSNDGPKCEGSTLALTSNTVVGALSYTWSGPNGFQNSNQNIQLNNITPNQDNDVYTITVVDANNCSSSATTVIHVITKDIINLVPPGTICSNLTTTTITATPPGGSWSGTGIAANGTIQPNTLPVGNNPFTYTSNGTCPNSALYQIAITKIPDINFVTDKDSVCEGEPFRLTDISNDLNSDIIWDLGNGQTSTELLKTNHVYNQSGTYTISLTSVINGCTNKVTKTNYIHVLKRPVASFTYDPTKPNTFESTIQFYNSSLNATSYKWFFGNGNSSTSMNPIYAYPAEAGAYNVRLIAINRFLSCSDTVQQTIVFPEAMIYYVPNTFTPNGDELNNVFQPVFSEGVSDDNYTLYIFNRWGELLFESHNKDVGWDGTFGSKICMPGTYIWKLEFRDKLTLKRNTHTGHVNLLN